MLPDESILTPTGVAVKPPDEREGTPTNGFSSRPSRTLDEIAYDYVAYAASMPPPDRASIMADAQWYEENYRELHRKYPGTYIAIVDKQVQDASTDPEMELEVARRLHIHPDRILTICIPDPSDP